MNKHKIDNIAAQGDILLIKVNDIPDAAEKVESKTGKFVLAHSETGHDHFMMSTGVEMFKDPNDDMVCYLQVQNLSDLIHDRPFDTHETLTLTSGKWQVRRQREHTPEGWRRVED